uniref:Uncharacterized protein n=1 Tax=Octopus bimaculoides TaxID=37653 RepID=A0A0L8H2V5_OCTBM
MIVKRHLSWVQGELRANFQFFLCVHDNTVSRLDNNFLLLQVSIAVPDIQRFILDTCQIHVLPPHQHAKSFRQFRSNRTNFLQAIMRKEGEKVMRK